MADAQWILVGIVGAPHGVKGEVRVKSYTASPADIGRYRPLRTEGGRRDLAMTHVRLVKDDMVVARFEGVATREAAAALTSQRLYIERSVLAQPDDEEFYHADLIGLLVRTEAGVDLGHVTAVLNFGAGDMLEVASAGKESVLIPFTKLFVPIVDVAGRSLTVTAEALGGDEPDSEPDESPGPDAAA